jgi:putative membrane protein
LSRFFQKLLITTLSLGVASYLIDGIVIIDWQTLVIAAFVLNLVNAFLRPLLLILTIPITIVSFGFFILVINGLMIALTAALLPGFYIHSIGSAVIGWIVMAITSWLANQLLDNPKNS